MRLRVLICSSCGLGEECLTELKEFKYIACTFCAGFMLRSHGEMDQCYMNIELKLPGPSAVWRVYAAILWLNEKYVKKVEHLKLVFVSTIFDDLMLLPWGHMGEYFMTVGKL